MIVRRWTMVGDTVVHSRETGHRSTPGARPLVLVHGVGTTTRYFRPLLTQLDDHVPAAAVDLPGIGPSSPAPLPNNLTDQAHLLAAWLHATRRRPAALVGNSMGAQTVVEFALHYPELTPQLVLIGPTMDPRASGPLRQIGRLLRDATVERPSLIWLTLTDTFLTRRRAVLRYFRAALEHPMEERITDVQVPVLVIRGDRDPIVPLRWARQLAELARRGELVEVAGGAHACHHGRPQAVADLLTAAVDVSNGQPTR